MSEQVDQMFPFVTTGDIENEIFNEVNYWDTSLIKKEDEEKLVEEYLN